MVCFSYAPISSMTCLAPPMAAADTHATAAALALEGNTRGGFLGNGNDSAKEEDSSCTMACISPAAVVSCSTMKDGLLRVFIVRLVMPNLRREGVFHAEVARRAATASASVDATSAAMTKTARMKLDRFMMKILFKL
mmetsp:Transcript_28953/g.53452  ORF Transcript_28953/g.53452 Transcript_28953/m.53452 type:complete len:137 (-) Transcript_28953:223-633(-)